MRTLLQKTAATAILASLLFASSPAALVSADVLPIHSVHIASNNTDSAHAKVGDTVTVTFTTPEASTTPSVTIAGHEATVSGGPTSWSASYSPLQSSDTEGVVSFSITSEGTVVTATSDSSSVTFDHTQPTLVFTSGSPSTTGDNPIYVTATFSEPVTGFDGSKLNIGNGSVTAFVASSSTIYTFGVIPAADGSVSVDLNGDIAMDAAGNKNMAAPQLQRIFQTGGPTSTPPGSGGSGGDGGSGGTGTTTASTTPTITFTGGPTEGSSVGTSTVTFTFTVDMEAALSCIFGGGSYTCGSPQTFTGLGDSAYTFSVVAATSTGTATSTIHFTVDTVSPVISEVTAVSTPSTTTTPSYTFFSNEAGSPLVGGSCSTAATSTPMGTSTITFNALGAGTYSDCTVKLQDAAGNNSNTLALAAFTITAPPSTGGSSSGGSSSGGGGGGGILAGPLSVGYQTPTPQNNLSSTPTTPIPTPAPTPDIVTGGPIAQAPTTGTGTGTTNTGGAVLGEDTEVATDTEMVATTTDITTPTTDQTAAVADTGFSIPTWAWILLAILVLIGAGWWLASQDTTNKA